MAHVSTQTAAGTVSSLPVRLVRGEESDWDLPRHPSTVREIIEGLDPLLEAIRLQLGSDADGDALLDQLGPTLSFGARESSLPLAHVSDDDTLRRDLAAQARAISGYIVRTAREVNESRVSIRRHGEERLGNMLLRSRCDGHLWQPGVNAQLTGPRGGAHVMQLYNEWLHQIVLLRDILVPFANWETLPIPLQRLAGARGLRALEEPRARFVGELLTKQVGHGTIVGLAQAVFGLEREENCYGFTVDGVTVLPASAHDDPATAPKALLKWGRRGIAGLEDAPAVRFRYAADDYFLQSRSEIGASTASATAVSASASLAGRLIGGKDALVDLVVTTGDWVYRVDLGQALRGHRFAYRPSAEPHDIRFGEGADGTAVFHDLAELFSQEGMATASDGIHVVIQSDDHLVNLAILGKIYPENTVIRGEASWLEVLRSGKNYGARFVLQSDTGIRISSPQM